ncbi:CRISPR-associated exonuclease, Cas4 family [Clostridium cavendishii DSM 21758]|uniref:CRISPR-associated exonuclease, Cas4 family n=1 Tax=Clostridium cavendishii DSM 21758 TaxID=1121302 RepID=A0A1M6VCV6_9CLOT|nr:CRISPR-associated protein Cas4 [Clostridium cavendishii]SHK79367.1 CRISPR-associated exonuclease, Cas4 family [Clostridium cavendishii DSM 21758]
MRLTGTLINYYFHCKRQCWLLGNRINLEDNSEEVRIGRVLHEIKAEGNRQAEITIDNVKIDKITGEYLVEIKKSDADIEAVKWQVLLYLKVLKSKGIDKKGKIQFLEKNKKDTKTEIIELDEENEKKLQEIDLDIKTLINSPKAPGADLKKGCKKCAYYEYCYI